MGNYIIWRRNTFKDNKRILFIPHLIQHQHRAAVKSLLMRIADYRDFSDIMSLGGPHILVKAVPSGRMAFIDLLAPEIIDLKRVGE